MKTIYKVLFCFSLLTMFCGCGDSFLSLNSKDTVTESGFFVTEDDAQSALNGVYASLQSEAVFMRNSADFEWGITGDMYEMDRSTKRIELHSLQFPANNINLQELYRECYLGISKANVVLDKVPEIKMDETVKKQILGQAQFIRGIYYYNLVQFFGGVPLVTKALTASDDLQIPRNSAEEVWDQVEKDLSEAASNLPDKWTKDSDKGRATKSAAWGFLAKTYLWREKWEEAISVSENIINSGNHALIQTGYRDVFREENENNEEMIFSIQFSTLTGEQNNLVARTAPRGAPSKYTGPQAWSNYVPSAHLVKDFEVNADNSIKDDRYSVILGPGEVHPENGYLLPIDAPATMTKTGYVVSKYWYMPPVQNSGINYPMLRYAEVLLNYAEALNEKGQSAKAIEYINQVRARAKLDPKPSSLTKEQILDAIYYERRCEFIWENPGGFSDLNRRGRFLDFIKKNRPDYKELEVDKKPWLHTKPILFPIPTDAWAKNKALEQNPHYSF